MLALTNELAMQFLPHSKNSDTQRARGRLKKFWLAERLPICAHRLLMSGFLPTNGAKTIQSKRLIGIACTHIFRSRAVTEMSVASPSCMSSTVVTECLSWTTTYMESRQCPTLTFPLIR